MSAPILWIAIPLIFAIPIGIPRRDRFAALAGGLLGTILSLTAWILPIDAAFRIGTFSFRIDSSVTLFGQTISLTAADQPMLVLVYGIAAFWFLGTLAVGDARRIVPPGLIATSLLITSLAVKPFLYAALLIELAVLITIPMLSAPNQKAGRGAIRFLIYQTLAMPCILFAGFLLAGVEAGPGDTALIIQAAILLGMGFALLLAVFPFHTWIALLTEEAPPYAVGFVLILFPTTVILFGLGFLDRYAWLRESPQLSFVLQLAGLLMLASGGLFAAFQRHIGRIFGYAAIAETGISLLALTLPDRPTAIMIIFLLIIPRALALGVWAMGIAVIKHDQPSLMYSDLQGLARRFPFATAGMVLASLSIAGMPLLASFPIRQTVWSNAAGASILAAFWIGIGSLGLWSGALRTLAVLVMAPAGTKWEAHETPAQKILLGLGVIGLILFGLFPQWIQPFLNNLPAMFERLGQ
jgi:NADH:ubiquinone oxidoreductase subunit 2 (subunit N)